MISPRPALRFLADLIVSAKDFSRELARDKRRGQALALLALGVLCAYAYQWAPTADQAMVWNASQAAMVAAALAAFATLARSPAVWLVCSLLIGFALETLGCSLAIIRWPWFAVSPGEELCHAITGRLPLGTLGLMAALLVAAKIKKAG